MFEIELTQRDAAGRVSARNIAGRSYEYEYDALGRFAAYTDLQDPLNNAQYTYDHLGRRISMTVGNEVTRFVYQGNDVVAEYHDINGDGSVDRKRIYWLLPDLDQRIGFVDIDSQTKKVYYYLTDQVGSVLQIVDSSGTVVNQYDYDAFGNPRWENCTISSDVPNRYMFQGREWDDHAGHYYFRYRTYFPEYGSFSGYDIFLGNGPLGEPNGVGSYCALGNNPMTYRDPTGLGNEYSYRYGGNPNFFTAEEVDLSYVPPSPPTPKPIFTERKTYIVAASSVRYAPPPDRNVLTDGSEGARCLRQCDMFVPSHFIDTPMGEKITEMQSGMVVMAFAAPGLVYISEGIGCELLKSGAGKVIVTDQNDTVERSRIKSE